MAGNSSSGVKFSKPRESVNFLLCIPKQNAALAREFDVLNSVGSVRPNDATDVSSSVQAT